MTKKHQIADDDDDLGFGDILDEEEKQEDVQWYTQYPVSKIIHFPEQGGPGLYLGNIYHAMELTYNGNPIGITAVLDVSTEPDYEQNPNITYLRVPFHDGHEIPPDKFSQCMAFLKFCWENNHIILVNCAAGISRSTSIVVSFIHWNHLGYHLFTPRLDTMDKILDYVRLCRPIVFPAPRVINSCKKWLREPPYDGTYGQAEPEGKLERTVRAQVATIVMKLHGNPDCPVRVSILADDNQQRHLLKCTCK